jgi:predicted RNA-binding protein with PUA-like domain
MRSREYWWVWKPAAIPRHEVRWGFADVQTDATMNFALSLATVASAPDDDDHCLIHVVRLGIQSIGPAIGKLV